MPKSLEDLGSASSSVRYWYSFFQLKMYTPIDALLDLGLGGFSSNSTMRLFSSVFMMPKRLASSHGTSRTAMVQSASLWMWSMSMAL